MLFRIFFLGVFFSSLSVAMDDEDNIQDNLSFYGQIQIEQVDFQVILIRGEQARTMLVTHIKPTKDPACQIVNSSTLNDVLYTAKFHWENATVINLPPHYFEEGDNEFIAGFYLKLMGGYASELFVGKAGKHVFNYNILENGSVQITPRDPVVEY